MDSERIKKKNGQDMKKKWKKLCTASNKAFLCISSHIVTFFLIEQSYVAKTSCKMSAKHLRFSWWHINSCGQNNQIFCFHRVGVNIFSVLAAWRTIDAFDAEDESRNRGVTLRSVTPKALTFWLAWWPCYEEGSRDGCRWASSFQLVSKSARGTCRDVTDARMNIYSI